MSDPFHAEPIPPQPVPAEAGREGDRSPQASGGGVDGHDAEAAAAIEPEYPWEADAPPDTDADPDAPSERHDAFTEARKRAFLRALAKAGCILDACRAAGIAPRTVYRHQESDPRFAGHVRAALEMAAIPVELLAWQRAVEGVEQPFACGGEVHVRRRYSDSLLRLLLQATDPKKYGPHPGFSRKRLRRWERKEMEREIRAELEAKRRPRTLDEMRDSILRKLGAIEAHREPEKLAAGWTKSPDGHWVPPGYAPIPGWTPPAGADPRAGEAPPDPDTPRDSM